MSNNSRHRSDSAKRRLKIGYIIGFTIAAMCVFMAYLALVMGY